MGNPLTSREATEKFGADPVGLSLADAGDSLGDVNFKEKTANANILRVHTLLGWCGVGFTISTFAGLVDLSFPQSHVAIVK